MRDAIGSQPPRRQDVVGHRPALELAHFDRLVVAGGDVTMPHVAPAALVQREGRQVGRSASSIACMRLPSEYARMPVIPSRSLIFWL